MRVVPVSVRMCVAASLLAPPAVWSQAITTATLSGTVTDAAAAVVPNAQVVAKNVATQLEYKATTNELGVYRLLNLPPGTYNVSATATGFQTAVRSNIQLFVNQASTQDIQLQVGSVDTRVEITGAAPMLQTGTSSIGTVIDSRQVVDLPLNGRVFTQLMALTPGVSPYAQNQDVTPGIGTKTSQLSNSSFVPSVNGQPSRSNLFFVDGIYDSDPFFTSFAIAPSVDIIREFNVESHNDTAEVGQAVGGIVNVITRSGTEKLHGTAYEFNRNKAVEARNFFDPQDRPNFNQNQFGFTLGGPVPLPKLRGKTWFFGGYEGFRFVRGSTIFSRVPSEAEWNGDFSAFLGPVVGADALGRPVQSGQIFNPHTGRATTAGQTDQQTGLTAVRTGWVRDPFPGNRIPTSLFNPIVAWKRWVPAPNLAAPAGTLGPNFLNTQSSRTNLDSWNVRLDHQFGPNDTVYGRFLYNDTDSLTPAAMPTVPSVNQRNFRNLGVHWIHNFGPTLFLDLNYGFQHGRAPGFARQPDDKEQLFRDAGFDRPDGAYVLGGGGGLPQFPGIGIQDYAGTGSSSGAAFNPQLVHQVRGDISKITGRHTIKLGAIWFHADLTHFGACPSVSFSRVQTNDNLNLTSTGNGLASFLLGVPSGGLVYNGDVGAQLITNVFGIYAQDSVKVTPKLTVNFGLRWDYSQPPVEANDRLSAFDQAIGKFVLSGTKVPPDCATTNGAFPCIPGGQLPENVVMFGKRGMVNPVRDNFSPRLGVAYRLNNRTVVRAGFGMHYDNWAFMVQNSQDPRGGWPFGLQRRPLPGLNETRLDVFAQNILPRNATPPATPFPAGQRVNDSDYKNSYIVAWNLDVQRQITDSLTVTTAYVGSRGHRTYTGFLQNTARTPGPGPINTRVPFPLLVPGAFGARSNGRSWYDAFQFKAEQRYSRGVSFLVSYTWSKSMDLGCSGFAGIEGCSIQDPYNLWASKSVSGFDVPHHLSVGYIWELPFGTTRRYLRKGPAAHILGNWQFNGIFETFSGQPVTVVTGFDTANTASNANRPDQVGNPIPGNRDRLNWFNRSAFQPGPDCRVVSPDQCRFGYLGRNTLRGPGFWNIDTSIFRDFPTTEQFGKIQLRFEFFNVLNHTNFITGGFGNQMTLSSDAFGRLFAAAPARQIQFAGKWIF